MANKQLPQPNFSSKVASLISTSNTIGNFIFLIISPSILLILFYFLKLTQAEWQDGKLSTYFDIFVTQGSILFFSPLFFYSLVSAYLLLTDFKKYSKLFRVRLGIYSGLVLAATYHFLGNYALFGLSSRFLFVTLLGVPLFFMFFCIIFVTFQKLAKLAHISNIQFYFLSLLLLIASGFLAFPPGMANPLADRSREILGMLFVGWIICTPGVAAIFAFRLCQAVWQSHNHDNSKRTLWSLGVLSTYVASISLSVQKTLELYNALPKTQPGCYIATASTYGHQSFVNSSHIHNLEDKTLTTTSLQRAKYFEISMSVVAPSLHASLRRVYNFFGPSFASFIKDSPWLCDLAHILLKPIDWISTIFLHIFPNHVKHVAKIYIGSK